MGANPRDARLDALDSVRALLMVLGLWIHAAAPYRDRAAWLVDDRGGQAWLGASSHWLATFRMPAFFLLAGLLAAWALPKRGALEFIKRRALRLLLPLTAGILSFNYLQYLLLDDHVARHCVPFADCAVALGSSPWLGHLWFLADLMLYSVVLAAGWPFIARLGRRLANSDVADSRPGGSGAQFAAGLALAVVAYVGWKLAIGLVTLAVPRLRDALLGFWSFAWVADHGYFFFLGVVLGFLPRFRQWLAAPVPLAAPLALGAAGTLAWWVEDALALTRNSLGEKALFALVSAIPVMLLVAFAICAILRMQARLASLLRAASRWSYSIYLVHHLIVVAVALALLPLAIPAAVKFAIVLTTVLAFSVATAILIERWSLLRLLFNGEWSDAGIADAERSTATPRSDGAQVAPLAPAAGSAALPGLEEHPDARILLAGAAAEPTPPRASQQDRGPAHAARSGAAKR